MACVMKNEYKNRVSFFDIGTTIELIPDPDVIGSFLLSLMLECRRWTEETRN